MILIVHFSNESVLFALIYTKLMEMNGIFLIEDMIKKFIFSLNDIVDQYINAHYDAKV